MSLVVDIRKQLGAFRPRLCGQKGKQLLFSPQGCLCELLHVQAAAGGQGELVKLTVFPGPAGPHRQVQVRSSHRPLPVALEHFQAAFFP